MLVTLAQSERQTGASEIPALAQPKRKHGARTDASRADMERDEGVLHGRGVSRAEGRGKQAQQEPIASHRAIVARALVSYHLERQRPMMSAFLDELGIAHDNGLIADEAVPAPAPEKLSAAAKALADTFPIGDVRLYFSTLVSQDPETWGGLVDELQQKA